MDCWPLEVQVEPLTKAAFTPYGQVISSSDQESFKPANQGSAKRFDFVANLCNKRDAAQPNLAVFHCFPREERPFLSKVLERHAYSSQAFIPMNARSHYLVIVCLPCSQAGATGPPDPLTFKAFLARKDQGVNYNAGVWHHPMVALDAETDFVMLVWEDGTPNDCEVMDTPSITIRFST